MKIDELDWNEYLIDNINRDCFDLILAAGQLRYYSA